MNSSNECFSGEWKGSLQLFCYVSHWICKVFTLCRMNFFNCSDVLLAHLGKFVNRRGE